MLNGTTSSRNCPRITNTRSALFLSPFYSVYRNLQPFPKGLLVQIFKPTCKIRVHPCSFYVILFTCINQLLSRQARHFTINTPTNVVTHKPGPKCILPQKQPRIKPISVSALTLPSLSFLVIPFPFLLALLIFDPYLPTTRYRRYTHTIYNVKMLFDSTLWLTNRQSM